MRFSIKKTADALSSILAVAFFVTATHFFLLKPAIDESVFKVIVAEETSNLFRLALDGDVQAIAWLEKFAHEGSMSAYLFLNIVYNEQATNAAGINIKELNPNFSAADFTKSSNLLLQAVRELDDNDLLYVLKGQRSKFDTELQAKIINKESGENIRSENIDKRETFSTFDQPTKDKLLACHNKLKEKLPNMFFEILYIRSHGACLDNPVNLTPMKYYAYFSEIFDEDIGINAANLK